LKQTGRALLGLLEVAGAAPHRTKGTVLYFWGTIAVVFVLACVIGWKMDRKHRRHSGAGRSNASEALDGRANEALMRNRRDNGPG
jgi:hypothetical protein